MEHLIIVYDRMLRTIVTDNLLTSIFAIIFDTLSPVEKWENDAVFRETEVRILSCLDFLPCIELVADLNRAEKVTLLQARSRPE